MIDIQSRISPINGYKSIYITTENYTILPPSMKLEALHLMMCVWLICIPFPPLPAVLPARTKRALNTVSLERKNGETESFTSISRWKARVSLKRSSQPNYADVLIQKCRFIFTPMSHVQCPCFLNTSS